MILIVVLLLAYLLGSIPFGLILTRMAGLGDVRNIGSGNIGATNVLRTGNKKLAALTLLLDGGKGWLAMWLAVWLSISWAGLDTDNPKDPLWILGLFPLFATLGHVFPVWLRFKGGKGVATLLGCMLYTLFLPIGLICIGVWLFMFWLFRISSLAALAAFWVGTAIGGAYYFIPAYAADRQLIVIFAELYIPVLLVTWRHKDNIKRLLAGTEPKFGKKAS